MEFIKSIKNTHFSGSFFHKETTEAEKILNEDAEKEIGASVVSSDNYLIETEEKKKLKNGKVDKKNDV